MMKRMRRIESPKVARLLFLLCWFAYFTSYIGRLNYSSAMTEMIQGTILTKSQAGFISMVYFFAYGIGQLCNGILGDKFHPGKMIFTGLAIAAGANLCMGFAGGFQVMAVIWGINGYAQAMIWPPIIRIFAEMVSREQKMKFCVDIWVFPGTWHPGFLSAGRRRDVADRLESGLWCGSHLSGRDVSCVDYRVWKN